MVLLFCQSFIEPKEIDEDFLIEFKAAQKENIECLLFNQDQLIRGDVSLALKNIPLFKSPKTVIYRGWMLKPLEYTALYNALIRKNLFLINNPEEYKHCHYLPCSYKLIEKYTAKTVWEPVNNGINWTAILKKLEVFNGKAIILKDYVKSLKHYWKEACYIKESHNMENVKSVVSKFMEYNDNEINEGLVFRKYLELEKLTSHSKSGMPLSMEFRAFVLNGKILDIFNYWNEGVYKSTKKEIDFIYKIAEKIESNFFTIDIAKTISGEWKIIELGDGQVAEIPEKTRIDKFYHNLKESLKAFDIDERT